MAQQEPYPTDRRFLQLLPRSESSQTLGSSLKTGIEKAPDGAKLRHTESSTRVVPEMTIGASDSRFTNAAGMPSYGLAGIAIDTSDVRALGKDECLPVQSFETGVQFYYRYLKALVVS